MLISVTAEIRELIYRFVLSTTPASLEPNTKVSKWKTHWLEPTYKTRYWVNESIAERRKYREDLHRIVWRRGHDRWGPYLEVYRF